MTKTDVFRVTLKGRTYLVVREINGAYRPAVEFYPLPKKAADRTLIREAISDKARADDRA